MFKDKLKGLNRKYWILFLVVYVVGGSFLYLFTQYIMIKERRWFGGIYHLTPGEWALYAPLLVFFLIVSLIEGYKKIANRKPSQPYIDSNRRRR